MVLAVKFVTLLYLLVALGTFASIICAWILWRARFAGALARAFAGVLAAITVEDICQVISTFDGQVGPSQPRSWFVWWRIGGKLVKYAAVWALMFLLLGRKNKG